MSAKGVLRIIEGDRVGFFCPGCKEMHVIGIPPNPRPWGFNGDYDKPTFTPSILVSSVKTIKDADGEWTGEWERDAAGNTIPEVCHSFVTDGNIQFLGDCTHDLAGQTLPLQKRPVS